MANLTGTVYLIHFDENFGHARHYLGFCENGNLEDRIATHRAGGHNAARLLQVIGAAGIGWQVVRTWKNVDRNFERKLKNKKKSSTLCPVCRAERMAANDGPRINTKGS